MAKAKKKAKKKNPNVGHNSDGARDMDEIRKIAKAQRLLDRKKRDALAEFKQQHKDLTNRLEKAGISREEFADPYKKFCKLADCDTDEDAKVELENQKIFLANQRRTYDALNPGGQMDWIDLVQDAEQIQKLRDEAEAEAARAAAEGADEPEETAAEI